MAKQHRDARSSGAQPVTPPEKLRRLPSWLFSQLAARGNRLLAEHLSDGGRRSDFAVLAALEDAGPLSQAEIVRRLAIDRGDLSVLLERLDAEGLTVRSADPLDARRKQVTITSKGRAALARWEPSVVAAQEQLLARLTPTQRGALLRMLTRLLEPDDPADAS